jgi:hypothetical protein
MFGPEDIALTMGGQNAVNIAFQCCLRGDRPVVFCEELAYPGFRRAARLNRADVVAIALDEEGMVPEALDAACRRTGGRIVCITPDAQNPTAAHMSLKRRQAIVAVARAHMTCRSSRTIATMSLIVLSPHSGAGARADLACHEPVKVDFRRAALRRHRLPRRPGRGGASCDSAQLLRLAASRHRYRAHALPVRRGGAYPRPGSGGLFAAVWNWR